MMAFDLRALVGTLAREDVAFVLIGGVAVAAHGHVRATEDVDLVPDPSPENLDRLADGLIRIGGSLESGKPVGDAERRALRRGRNLTVSTQHGDIDVIQRLPGVPSYSELQAEAVDVDLLGSSVRICSLPHLRAMKRVRGDHQDLADLERLPKTPD